MTKAEELLDSLPEDQVMAYSVDPASEPHIVINLDRTVTVPDDLKHIAVKGDHNIETVTFDGPRYWDGHDLSEMQLRVVFQRPDGHREPHPVENLRVDSDDESVIHFDWTISGNVTAVQGNISFTVCGKLSNAEGVREREWHTRLNQDLIVDEGMDCSNDEIVEQNPDIIEAILVQLDELKNATPDSEQNAVLYTRQELTEEQQEQARKNIGAAPKSEVADIKTGLDCFTKIVGVLSPIDFETIADHCITNSGKITTTSAANRYSISSHIPVVPGETVYITASETYANAFYAFYRGDGTVVSIKQDPNNSWETSEIVDEAVVVPAEAETLVISFPGDTIGAVKRIKPAGGLKLQPWKGRIWTAVGDSLTEKNSRTDLNYHDYIAEATGITVINQGYSGSGYAKTGAGQAFHLRINKVPANSDVVTIFGSFNDYSAGIELGTPSDTGTETICGCINTTIDNLIAVMPTVSLGIVTPTPWQSGNPADPNNAQTKYADALVEICKNRSIPCLDLYRCSNLRPWTEEGRLACYSKDEGNGTHPDETGHKLIAARFKAFLESLIM